MEYINNYTILLSVIIISYLFGSIPFGYILTKFFLKKDLRTIGSGNIGATNALRTGNKIIGYTTLFFDIFKAIIPVIWIKFNNVDYLYITSLCVFIGHVFPIWLKFKGGKGVATYLGILFCFNIYFGISFIIIWIVLLILFKYSSLSSLTASFSMTFVNLYFLRYENIYFFIIMFVIIFYNHRGNVKRLINKTETKTKIF